MDRWGILSFGHIILEKLFFINQEPFPTHFYLFFGQVSQT